MILAIAWPYNPLNRIVYSYPLFVQLSGRTGRWVWGPRNGKSLAARSDPSIQQTRCVRSSGTRQMAQTASTGGSAVYVRMCHGTSTIPGSWLYFGRWYGVSIVSCSTDMDRTGPEKAWLFCLWFLDGESLVCSSALDSVVARGDLTIFCTSSPYLSTFATISNNILSTIP